MPRLRWILIGPLLGLLSPLATATDPDPVEVGRLIYQEGRRPSGEPLVGRRPDGSALSGAKAACMACHRRSGMGTVEGQVQVPPITGQFLFAVRRDAALATMDRRGGKSFNLQHPPYTEADLGRVIREGVNNLGRTLQLMPQYDLSATEMAALTAYLRGLSAQWSPGVSADTIRFATVIAPSVDSRRRQALLDTLGAAVAQKNGSTVLRHYSGGRRHMVSAAEMILGTERMWTLDVWELQGPAETWGAQLEEFYRQRPVFAVLSGLSDGHWAPVHDFCQRSQVPCWFPSVDLPVASEAFYPVYFSRGVELEADVLARHLSGSAGTPPRRLVQVYRDDAAARGGARALSRALAASGIAIEDRLLADASAAELARGFAGLGEGDALVAWLRPSDLAALAEIPPPPTTAYVSTVLGNGEPTALPTAWRERLRLVYPYELPGVRRVNMEYFHAWLKLRKLPLVDEVLQAEAYFAVDFLTETLSEMLDNVYRDYLLERAEDMLSKRELDRAQERARDRATWGRGPQTQTGQQGTSLYPRLSLGPGQRFASKGAYIARIAQDGGLVAETPWLVP